MEDKIKQQGISIKENEMLGEWHAVRRRGSDTVTVVGLVCQETIGIIGRAKVKMAIAIDRCPQA